MTGITTTQSLDGSVAMSTLPIGNISVYIIV